MQPLALFLATLIAHTLNCMPQLLLSPCSLWRGMWIQVTSFYFKTVRNQWCPISSLRRFDVVGVSGFSHTVLEWFPSHDFYASAVCVLPRPCCSQLTHTSMVLLFAIYSHLFLVIFNLLNSVPSIRKLFDLYSTRSHNYSIHIRFS